MLTPHARLQMTRRGLSKAVIEQVLRQPEQHLPAGGDRVILQSRIPAAEHGQAWLVRVLVDVSRSPAEVVTAYRTSKIRKYWKDTE